MHGHGLTQTILLGGDGAGLVVCFAMLAVCGLVRPFEWSVRVKLPRRARPQNAPATTLNLNAIELGLLAELSLEQARAHEELLGDPTQRPEARRAAAATAAAWRERARGFQSQARLEAAAPVVPDEHPSRAYTGPERRRQTRRRQSRRIVAPASRGAADLCRASSARGSMSMDPNVVVGLEGVRRLDPDARHVALEAALGRIDRAGRPSGIVTGQALGLVEGDDRD